MPRFLATHRLAPAGPRTWRDELEALARAAHEVGVRPVQTFYAAERFQAYTLYDATDAEAIRLAHERAHVAAPTEIAEGEQVYTELLAEPRRDRFA